MAVLRGSTEGETFVVTHEYPVSRFLLSVARLAIGWTFLWAFLDHLFGLGRPTPAAEAWLEGGSPTEEFLSSATGPVAEPFRAIAGSPVADWLFMIGLAAIGLALILGIGIRLATAFGVLLLVLMFAAELPADRAPGVDDTLIYSLVLGAIAFSHAGDALGLGPWWARTRLVQRFPFLR